MHSWTWMVYAKSNLYLEDQTRVHTCILVNMQLKRNYSGVFPVEQVSPNIPILTSHGSIQNCIRYFLHRSLFLKKTGLFAFFDIRLSGEIFSTWDLLGSSQPVLTMKVLFSCEALIICKILCVYWYLDSVKVLFLFFWSFILWNRDMRCRIYVLVKCYSMLDCINYPEDVHGTLCSNLVFKGSLLDCYAAVWYENIFLTIFIMFYTIFAAMLKQKQRFAKTERQNC